MMLRLIGDTWRRVSLTTEELNPILIKLRSQGCAVQTFQEGFDCEIDGTQVLRATEMETKGRYHVRLNSKVFPDI